MCLRKLFPGLFPSPVPTTDPIVGNNIALLFGIGSGYPGVQNDLIGPPYDLRHVKDFLASKYPEYIVKTFADTEVTRYSFGNTIKRQIAVLKPGDNLLIYYSGHGTNGVDYEEADGYREGIYLTDGTYWDDEFTLVLQDIPQGANVIIVLDSCFARGSTIPKGCVICKRKFVQTQPIVPEIKKTKQMLKSDDMNYIVFAACGENQTSADLGLHGGAFTMYWLKAWEREFNYLQWSNQTSKLLSADKTLDQVPNIDGDIDLMNKIIFS